MTLLAIFYFVERRFSRQKRQPRIPRTRTPNGTPIASPTVEATSNGSDDFTGAFLADDATLLAEENDDEIPFCAFFRLRTSWSRP
jgi:hypothetical protein